MRNVVWAAERYYSQAINISLKSPKHRNCSQNADATFSLGGGSSALRWGFYFSVKRWEGRKKKSLTSQQNLIRMKVHRLQSKSGGMVSRQRKQASPGQEPGALRLNDGFAGQP